MKIDIHATLRYVEEDHDKAMKTGSELLSSITTAVDGVLLNAGFWPNRIDQPTTSTWPGDYRPPRDSLSIEITFGD